MSFRGQPASRLAPGGLGFAAAGSVGAGGIRRVARGGGAAGFGFGDDSGSRDSWLYSNKPQETPRSPAQHPAGHSRNAGEAGTSASHGASASPAGRGSSGAASTRNQPSERGAGDTRGAHDEESRLMAELKGLDAKMKLFSQVRPQSSGVARVFVDSESHVDSWGVPALDSAGIAPSPRPEALPCHIPGSKQDAHSEKGAPPQVHHRRTGEERASGRSHTSGRSQIADFAQLPARCSRKWRAIGPGPGCRARRALARQRPGAGLGRSCGRRLRRLTMRSRRRPPRRRSCPTAPPSRPRRPRPSRRRGAARYRVRPARRRRATPG